MNRERPHWHAWPVGFLLAALFHGGSWALTDEEIFRDFRFNFINPGARALGLGGAFIAAADDATAAQANPAALHYVFRNEFFAEFRRVEPETQFFLPSGTIGDIRNVNSLSLPFLELRATTNREDASLLSFASFAYPFRLGTRRGTLALSRHVVLDVENSLRDKGLDTNLCFSVADFPIWVNPQASCARVPPGVQQYAVANVVDGNLKAELLHYNLGLSFSIVRDFSIGATATYATLDMKSLVTSTTTDPRGILFSRHPRLDTGSGFTPIQFRTAIDGSDEAFAYTLGLHWHPDSAFPSGYSPIRFGLVYRKGAELSVKETEAEQDPATQQFVPIGDFDNVLRVPDRFGIGTSFEAAEHWTFALDVERIQFSDLLEGFRPGVNFFTGPTLAGVTQIDSQSLVFEVDDATVVHAGVEFFFRSRGAWGHAFRAGYFNAPDNRIRLTQVRSLHPEIGPQIEAIFKDVFRGGEDQDHYTVGFSLNAPVGIQVQFAADFADDEKQYVASAIYRFGKTR